MKGKTMHKQLMTLMAFCALGVTTTAVPAFGGETETLRVTVPFAFTAGATNLPAGDYTVLEGNAHVLTIRGTGGSAMVLASSGDEGDRDRNALTFRHTDRGYFLQAVYAGGRPSTVLRPATEIER
jgi:hypothetical protein